MPVTPEIVGVLLDADSVPPHEVVQGAQAFAYFYKLPEMIETLRKVRMPKGQE